MKTKAPSLGRASPEDTMPEAPRVDENEMCLIMVLDHHRAQIENLHENGCHPMNFRALVEGEIDAPTGKTPVVLTFDDASQIQFTMVEHDGERIPGER